MTLGVRRGFAGVALALLLSGPLSGGSAAAQAGGLRLEDAGSEEIVRQLEAAVGAPVQVRGGGHQRLTLSVPPVSPAATLDRVAAALGGKWRLQIHVRAGRPAQPGSSPAPDAAVAIGLRDVPAARAFALIARHLKAELVIQGDLRQRVSLAPAEQPAAAALDRVAEQAGASWSLSYLIQLPDPTPEVRETPAPRPAPAPPPPLPGGGLDVYVPVVPSKPAVRPQPAPRIPTAAALRTGLWDALNYVIRIGPDQRAAAVGDFIEYGEETFALLSRLPPAEREQRVKEALPVLDQWRRLYRGLAPNVARELAPVTRFLEQHLR